jgi:hypothetical protein
LGKRARAAHARIQVRPVALILPLLGRASRATDRTYGALFKEKITQQQGLTDQLRKQKAALSENETGNLEQRKMFIELNKLLGAKLKSQRKESRIGFGTAEYDMGSAKVMRLDEGA